MIKKILITCFVIVLLSFFVSAIEWPLNKEATCDLFNKTAGIECETYWCNNIRGGSYNTTLEVCKYII